MIDLLEAALAEWCRDPGLRVDPGNPDLLQPLPRTDVKPPLAAVPVAAEHHHLALAHVQATIRVEAGLHRQFPPVERTGLDPVAGRDQEHHHQKQEPQVNAHPVPPCLPGRRGPVRKIRAEATKRW